jgi:hypothetical protein
VIELRAPVLQINAQVGWYTFPCLAGLRLPPVFLKEFRHGSGAEKTWTSPGGGRIRKRRWK